MDQQYLHLSSLSNSLEQFLYSQSRNFKNESGPLEFKLQQKTNLKITDNDGVTFTVNETYLNSFKDIYNDKQYKGVKVYNWEFQFEFEGKKCKNITLTSDNLVFVASKTQKKEIKDCTFRVHAYDEASISKLNKKIKGYLNRIGKRHIVREAENKVNEFHSLVGFIVPPKINIIEKIQSEINAESGKVDLDPLTFMTKDGIKILEKLRLFITRQSIFDFITNQEISEQGEGKLRKIILPDQIFEKKKIQRT